MARSVTKRVFSIFIPEYFSCVPCAPASAEGHWQVDGPALPVEDGLDAPFANCENAPHELGERRVSSRLESHQ